MVETDAADSQFAVYEVAGCEQCRHPLEASGEIYRRGGLTVRAGDPPSVAELGLVLLFDGLLLDHLVGREVRQVFTELIIGGTRAAAIRRL